MLFRSHDLMDRNKFTDWSKYTQDQVVISLRLVSVQSGEILTSVTIEKNLLSTQDGATGIRFYNQGTRTIPIFKGKLNIEI